eukprot:2974703-Pyramimonas_sp.AAC.1
MELLRKRRDLRELLRREGDCLFITIADSTKLDTAKVDYIPREDPTDNPYAQNSDQPGAEDEPDPRRLRLEYIEAELKNITAT